MQIPSTSKFALYLYIPKRLFFFPSFRSIPDIPVVSLQLTNRSVTTKLPEGITQTTSITTEGNPCYATQLTTEDNPAYIAHSGTADNPATYANLEPQQTVN